MEIKVSAGGLRGFLGRCLFLQEVSGKDISRRSGVEVRMNYLVEVLEVRVKVLGVDRKLDEGFRRRYRQNSG